MFKSFNNNKVISSLIHGAKQALPHTLFMVFSILMPVPIRVMNYCLKVNLPLAFITVDMFARCDQNSKLIKNHKTLAHENHKLITEYFFYGCTTLIPKIFFSSPICIPTSVENLKANLPAIALNFAAEALYHGENSSLDVIKEEVTNSLDYYLGENDNYHHYTILGAGFVAACFLG